MFYFPTKYALESFNSNSKVIPDKSPTEEEEKNISLPPPRHHNQTIPRDPTAPPIPSFLPPSARLPTSDDPELAPPALAPAPAPPLLTPFFPQTSPPSPTTTILLLKLSLLFSALVLKPAAVRACPTKSPVRLASDPILAMAAGSENMVLADDGVIGLPSPTTSTVSGPGITGRGVTSVGDVKLRRCPPPCTAKDWDEEGVGLAGEWWYGGGDDGETAPEARLKTLARMDWRRAWRVGEVSKKETVLGVL